MALRADACNNAFPVGAGLMLVLLYGREGWFAPVLRAAGFNVVFAFPGTFSFPLMQKF